MTICLPGSKASQATHAAFAFAVTHLAAVRDWHASSKALVVLSSRDEMSLGWLCADARAAGLLFVEFHEPDLGYALTAAAFEPAAHRLVSHLPLALSQRGAVRT